MAKTKYQEKLDKLDEARKEYKEMYEKTEEIFNKLDDTAYSPQNLAQKIRNLDNMMMTSRNRSSQIETYFNNLTNIKTQIDIIQNKTNENNDKILEDIEKYNGIILENTEKYNKQFNRNEELMDNISETLEIATSGVLAEGFEKRVKRMIKSRRLWAISACIMPILVTFILAFMLDFKINNLSDLWDIKSITVIPLFYLIYFTIHQFNRARDLEEKYTFKALMSQTLNNNIKLLKDEFGENSEEQRLNFTISTMDKIYKDPVKQTLMSFWLESRIARIGFKEHEFNKKRENK